MYTQEKRLYEKGFTRGIINKDNIAEEFDCYEDTLDYESDVIDSIIFNNLPEIVTIYRGCHKGELDNRLGQSWTLDLKVAEFFAYKYYSTWSYDQSEDSMFNPKNRTVIQLRVNKDDIIAYTNDREENECILKLDTKPIDFINLKMKENKMNTSTERYINTNGNSEISRDEYIELLTLVSNDTGVDYLSIWIDLVDSYPDWLEHGTEDEQDVLDSWFDEVDDAVKAYIDRVNKVEK